MFKSRMLFLGTMATFAMAGTSLPADENPRDLVNEQAEENSLSRERMRQAANHHYKAAQRLFSQNRNLEAREELEIALHYNKSDPLNPSFVVYGDLSVDPRDYLRAMG